MAKRKPVTYGVTVKPHDITDVISVTWRQVGVVLRLDFNLRCLPTNTGNQRAAIHFHLAPMIRALWFAYEVDGYDGFGATERVIAEVTKQVHDYIEARDAAALEQTA